MIKKVAAYCFIFIANIILFAHAVLPHHHHRQQVCIERTHCAGDDESIDHNKPAEEHQHDGNTSSAVCLLKLAVVLPSEQSRLLKECDNCTHKHDIGNLPKLEYLDLPPLIEIETSLSAQSPVVISFVHSSSGLRAPPMV